MITSFKQFLGNDDGATAIEYALIAGIVSIAIVTALTQVTGSLTGIFSNIATQFDNILG